MKGRILIIRAILAIILIGAFTYGVKKMDEWRSARTVYSNIQGTWKCTGMEMEGVSPEISERFKKDYVLRFHGRTLVREFDGVTDIGVFEVSSNEVPAKIFFGFREHDGVIRGKLGIVEVKGRRMRLCRSLSPGARAPKKFKSSWGLHSLENFERVEEPNQVEPIVTTPVDEVKPQSTQAHL